MGRELGCKHGANARGTFILSFEPFLEPRERFVEAAGNQALVMKIGETVPMKSIAR